MPETYDELLTICWATAAVYYRAGAHYYSALLDGGLPAAKSDLNSVSAEYRSSAMNYLGALEDCISYLISVRQSASRMRELQHLSDIQSSVRIILEKL